jgi:hypothetical protein
MQQRTVTPRRSFNAATRTNYQPIIWQPISQAGTDITFQLSQDSATLVRTGIPPVLAISLGALPTAVAWSGSVMVLTYPSAPPNPEQYQITPGTRQTRNTAGGYLAPGTLTLGLTTPPPAGTIFAPYCSGTNLRGAVADGMGGTTDSLISANSPSCGYSPTIPPFAQLSAPQVAATHIEISILSSHGPWSFLGVPGCYNVTTGEFPDTYSEALDVFKFFYTTPPTVGDIFRWDTPDPNVRGADGAYPGNWNRAAE